MNIQLPAVPWPEVEELEALLVEIVRRGVCVGPGAAPREHVDQVEELHRVDEPERDRDEQQIGSKSGSVTKKKAWRGFAPSRSAAS